MRQGRTQLLTCLSLLLISGCTLLPEAGPAPLQLQLAPLGKSQESRAKHYAADTQTLVVERPQSTPALNSRNIWYQPAPNQLMPFRDHIWSEPLPQQLQRISVDYLADQLSQISVHQDRPGIDATYRLSITLHTWHLDQLAGTLAIALYADLLTAEGKPLARWQWEQTETLSEISAPGMAAASQHWVQSWLEGLPEQLERVVAESGR
ncbi:ABC-type transport auxiliary lipoprotein family protein [Nitrincola alkalilacustris]|uniref:ABC-type transport auxiliary lipoprotein family protein n=1 Tax=Nitrincola alkalilacustris TaxID=1571224 RepID=UPI00124D14A7|nr:ABC-type transport auxiliary lipoprotein family protein [Nitrincola alkalilacustris]